METLTFFINFTFVYFNKDAGFKVYKQNVIVHIQFHTNIGTNQWKY